MFKKVRVEKKLLISFIKLAGITAIAGYSQMPAQAQLGCESNSKTVQIEAKFLEYNRSNNNQLGQVLNNQQQSPPITPVEKSGIPFMQAPVVQLPDHSIDIKRNADLSQFVPGNMAAPGSGTILPTDENNIFSLGVDPGKDEPRDGGSRELRAIPWTVVFKNGMDEEFRIGLYSAGCRDGNYSAKVEQGQEQNSGHGQFQQQQQASDQQKAEVIYVWNKAREKFERQEAEDAGIDPFAGQRLMFRLLSIGLSSVDRQGLVQFDETGRAEMNRLMRKYGLDENQAPDLKQIENLFKSARKREQADELMRLHQLACQKIMLDQLKAQHRQSQEKR